MDLKLSHGWIAIAVACATAAAVGAREFPNMPSTGAAQVPSVAQEQPSTQFAPVLPSGTTHRAKWSNEDADWPPAGVPDDLDPIYFFKTGCPFELTLVNWTDCTLYFRTFLDCDGDGVADTMNEHFVMPIDDETGVPWVETIKPKEDCVILYWGLFDVIPWDGCDPGWEQDADFPCAVHFL